MQTLTPNSLCNISLQIFFSAVYLTPCLLDVVIQLFSFDIFLECLALTYFSPLKTYENQMFADVFSGNQNGTMGRNLLKS